MQRKHRASFLPFLAIPQRVVLSSPAPASCSGISYGRGPEGHNEAGDRGPVALQVYSAKTEAAKAACGLHTVWSKTF